MAKSRQDRKSFKKGDSVEWNSPGGKSAGRVEKRLTLTTRIKRHVAKASKDNPQYLVRSDKSGKKAAHKPGGLKKRQ